MFKDSRILYAILPSGRPLDLYVCTYVCHLDGILTGNRGYYVVCTLLHICECFSSFRRLSGGKLFTRRLMSKMNSIRPPKWAEWVSVDDVDVQSVLNAGY